MRDEVVRRIANFVLRFASKQYRERLALNHYLGLVKSKELREGK